MISSNLKKITLIFFIVILGMPSSLKGSRISLLSNPSHAWQTATGFFKTYRNSAKTLYDNFLSGLIASDKTTPTQMPLDNPIVQNAPYWYNKLYRQAIERGPEVATKASLLVVIWYFLWFRSDRGTRPENQSKIRKLISSGIINEHVEIYVNNPITQIYSSLEYAMRDYFGSYYHGDWHYHYDGKNPLGFFGTTERKISDFQHGPDPFVIASIALLLYAYRNEIQGTIRQTKDKLYNLHIKMGAW